MAKSDVDRLMQELIASPANRCFVCSPANPVGLGLRFERDDGVVRSRFIPGEWLEGWAGVVHGGILAAVLDEAMAYTLFYQGVKAVTARMELRYRAPVHHGDLLDLEASMTKDTRRLSEVRGVALRQGAVVVEAFGTFIKLGALDRSALGM